MEEEEEEVEEVEVVEVGDGGRQRGEGGERGADKSNRPFAAEPLGTSGRRADTQRELKPLRCRLEG